MLNYLFDFMNVTSPPARLYLTPNPFYVVKQEDGNLFSFYLSLYGKSEEEVSSAGEQLASNKIYDGENTREGLSKREVFSF